MIYYLVEFACFEFDNIEVFLLSEDKHDDWCMCEPQEGYKHFKTIWHGEIQQLILTRDELGLTVTRTSY